MPDGFKTTTSLCRDTLLYGTDSTTDTVDGMKGQEVCILAASVIGTEEVASFRELTLSTLRRSNRLFLLSRRAGSKWCRKDNVGDGPTEMFQKRVPHEERKGICRVGLTVSDSSRRDSVQNGMVSANLLSCLQRPVCSCFGGADIDKLEIVLRLGTHFIDWVYRFMDDAALAYKQNVAS